ncbi:hypothetical protein LF41_288 [Lysobacter dokdonensis DS-58]|uniref:Uncharacterized protein n=1 Tax=Lysobacter dokdonensis DS-58 TaxID=1300345 RepID=A0A0A2WKG6_9GAMM|nr:TorF family putative porin [Lysobacter dokdonensis]KGQ18755.1 hypothetical protein LF41_288 [Lysobacter dokdonensis DS-58]
MSRRFALFLFAFGTPAAALATDTGATVGVTSDYVFRGISQTRERPALQVGGWIEGSRGWYASAWASNVDYGSASDAFAELDAVVGWRGEVACDWRGEINLTRFTYPGDGALAYTELIATGTWRERGWLMIGFSNDVFASGARGTYVQAGWRVPLAHDLRIELAAAQYFVSPHDYRHAQFTAAWTPRADIELRLTLHAPDANARRLFGDPADPRLEAAIQAAF